MKTVIQENSALEKATSSLKEKYDVMQKSARDAEMRLTQCEQYSRNRNLEIKGIPKTDDEKVMHLISKIGNLVGEQIADSDVEVCHRVPTRDAAISNVIVQFAQRHKRDSVLEKAKKKRLSACELGFDESTPVFVNEHLLKRLLGMTQAKKREYQWRFVWNRNCKIMARKSVGTPIVSITHEEDLVQIC